MFRKGPVAGGTLHHYVRTISHLVRSSPLHCLVPEHYLIHLQSYDHVAFEHTHPTTPTPNLASSVSSTINTLIFFGGLCDGPLTVPYSIPLAERLPASWRLVQPLIHSSYSGWGIVSLGDDVSQLNQLARYIKELRPSGKLVMMGHSTGCQDSIHYLTSPLGEFERERPPLDGVVLQAASSDRDAMAV